MRCIACFFGSLSALSLFLSTYIPFLSHSLNLLLASPKDNQENQNEGKKKKRKSKARRKATSYVRYFPWLLKLGISVFFLHRFPATGWYPFFQLFVSSCCEYLEERTEDFFSFMFRSNRETVCLVEGTGNLYPGQMGYRVVPGPLSGTTTATDALIPMYGSAMADSVAVKTPMKSDSGLTYAIPASRKRAREAVISNHHPLMSFPPSLPNQQQTDNRCGSFTFLGEDISYQIQQQQLEIDSFITEHVSLIVILIFLESGI